MVLDGILKPPRSCLVTYFESAHCICRPRQLRHLAARCIPAEKPTRLESANVSVDSSGSEEWERLRKKLVMLPIQQGQITRKASFQAFMELLAPLDVFAVE